MKLETDNKLGSGIYLCRDCNKEEDRNVDRYTVNVKCHYCGGIMDPKRPSKPWLRK